MSTKPTKILSVVMGIILAAAIFFVGIKFLLPWFAPFIAAALVAMLLEPVVAFLRRRAHIPRALGALICVLLLCFCILALVWGLFGKIFSEFETLTENLPQILSSAEAMIEDAKQWILGLLDSLPDSLDGYLQKAIEGLSKELAALPATLSSKLIPLVSAVAGATPDILLFTVTAIIGIYFFSASFTEIKQFILLQIPERFRSKARLIRNDLGRTIGHYFKVQGILSLMTFGELVVAFTLLKVEYSLSAALFTAVVDALPVFGAGTILIPWAVYCFIVGEIPRAIGLVISYCVITLLRNVVQAKLLGHELGLHPLVTLMSLYVGYKICGVLGMIIFPIIFITVKQLNDSGIIHLWKTPQGE